MKNIINWSKRRKILLGTLAVLPILPMALSCSVTELSDEESRIIRDFKTEEAKSYVEKLWFEKAINELYVDKNDKINLTDPLKNQIVKDIVKFHLAKELSTNSGYLKNIGSQLLKINDENGVPKYTVNSNSITSGTIVDLREMGIFKEYYHGYDDSFLELKIDYKGDGVLVSRIDAISEILMKEPKLNFLSKVYKTLLVTKYMKMKRDDYLKYHADYNESSLDESISSDDSFLLIKTLLQEKNFFKWKVTLKEDDLDYIEDDPVDRMDLVDPTGVNENSNISVVNNFMQGAQDSFIDKTGINTQLNKLSETLWTLKDFEYQYLDKSGANDGDALKINLNELSGFEGIQKQSSGGGKFSFNLAKYKESTTKDYWFGFIQDNELITKDIKYIPQIGDVASLEIGLGIMPIWNKTNSELTMKGTMFENNLNELTWLLYSNNATLYNDALTWLTASIEDGGKEVLLEVQNEKIRDLWIEEGLTFIKKPEE